MASPVSFSRQPLAAGCATAAPAGPISAERLHKLGLSWRAAAGELKVPERTLRHWRRLRRPRRPPRRGRPLCAVAVDQRNEVLRFVHRVTGPAVSTAALRPLFRDVPLCILGELLGRYRRIWRRRYRRTGYRL